jgi:hypothetical protein
MKLDIVDKLRLELRERRDSERQVVYILAELRKLLELESIARTEAGAPAGNTYFALKFYCDWAVHVGLDQFGAQRIVKRFNQYQKYMEGLMSHSNGGVAVDPGFLQELDKSLQLSRFREQLGAYLDFHDLDSAVATDEERWIDFLTRVWEREQRVERAQWPTFRGFSKGGNYGPRSRDEWAASPRALSG